MIETEEVKRGGFGGKRKNLPEKKRGIQRRPAQTSCSYEGDIGVERRLGLERRKQRSVKWTSQSDRRRNSAGREEVKRPRKLRGSGPWNLTGSREAWQKWGEGVGGKKGYLWRGWERKG